MKATTYFTLLYNFSLDVSDTKSIGQVKNSFLEGAKISKSYGVFCIWIYLLYFNVFKVINVLNRRSDTFPSDTWPPATLLLPTLTLSRYLNSCDTCFSEVSIDTSPSWTKNLIIIKKYFWTLHLNCYFLKDVIFFLTLSYCIRNVMHLDGSFWRDITLPNRIRITLFCKGSAVLAIELQMSEIQFRELYDCKREHSTLIDCFFPFSNPIK